MRTIIQELKWVPTIDPLIIKLKKNMFWIDEKLGGYFCMSETKVDEDLFDCGNPFQNPNIKIYNKIKRIHPKIKYCKIEFI
jgi:hypothetical protein